MNRVSVALSVAVILVFGLETADAAMPVVSNVEANQRAGTTGANAVVDITYDVVDTDSDSVRISVEMSADGGQTFDVPAETFSGDVGWAIPGVAKLIVWHAGVDVPDEYWEQCQVKVIADDREREIVVNLPGGGTMTMVWIDPGAFVMGSPDREPGRASDEGPQHEVTITQGFYLGKHELTQAQWLAVIGTHPWEWVGVPNNPNLPAVYISWDDIQTFVDSLNTAEGAEVYRLPTEAEWAYACRAREMATWSFGYDEGLMRDYAWYYDNTCGAGECYVHEVGTKQPNAWGLHDMLGDVWEWCEDGFRSYTSEPQADPIGPNSPDRVIRGGYYELGAKQVRSATRSSHAPNYRHGGIGARLLRLSP